MKLSVAAFRLGWCGLVFGVFASGCGDGSTDDASGGGAGGGGGTGEEAPIDTCPTAQAMAARPKAGVVQISVSEDHACALLAEGTVRCWGAAGYYGILGYGNGNDVGDDEPPYSVGNVDVGGTVTQVATGALNTCAILTDGTVRCWGAVHTGILDAEATDIVGDDEVPSSRPAISFGQPAIQIGVGTMHACVLLEDRSVRCWGSNEGGEAGTMSILDTVPVDLANPVELGAPVQAISVGNASTCALLEGGSVLCWGDGGIGGLGYGNTNAIGDDETPASVGAVSLGGAAKAVTVGRFDRCALLECGSLRCWGLNRYGSAGIQLEEPIGDDELPDTVPAVEVGGPVKRVSVGTEIADERSCALLFDNSVVCWGFNWSSGNDWRPVATIPIDLGSAAVDIAVGDGHACALLKSGHVRCWGDGDTGQLGHGDVNSYGSGNTVEALVVAP